MAEMLRKIIHVDMDAFYSSVEQRDDPALRGRPVVVAWRGPRSVVCAASYEARRYGVRSAMPAVRAERLCPDLVFVPPDFPRYKLVSQQIQRILLRHTPLVEPLSLDEAYLDVTESTSGLASATAIAKSIRAAIAEEVGLTASAGVAPVKFLAKVASDWRKPDGLFVIKPHQVDAFLLPLPVERLPGVGKVMQARLSAIGVMTVGDLQEQPADALRVMFGRYGDRLFELARGIDRSVVRAERPTQSISSEDTFENDLAIGDLEAKIAELSRRTWSAANRDALRVGRTVVLKLKTSDFRVLTRSLTPTHRPKSAEEIIRIALLLRDRVRLPESALFRLVGVGLGNFSDTEVEQPELFAELNERNGSAS